FARRPLCLLLRQFAVWTDSGGEPERSLTRDEMLDDVSLYWFTNTGTSSSRSYCLGAARALCQRGNVVLVDFWTYTCINWLRTLSYVRAWAEKYKDGVVVVGVHTPEFPFERDVDNVRQAAKEMNVEYPIALDSDYRVWRAFNNMY